MPLLKDEDAKAVKEMFEKDLEGEVNLVFFYDNDKGSCAYCAETGELLDSVAALDSRIKVTKYDFKASQKEAKYLGIDKVPAIIVGGRKMYNMVYYGIPSGYEFSSLLGSIIDASKGKTTLKDSTKERVHGIKNPVDIKVFVTPTCPWCPRAVRTAHQFAVENPNIHSSMIEASEFRELSTRYAVMGVPKVVINDGQSFEGAQPEEAFLEYVLAADSGK